MAITLNAQRNIHLTPQKIMQMATGFWSSKVLLTACSMNLFTILGKQPLNAEQLTEKLGLNPRAARDFFDALVALGFLNRKNGVYSNSAESAEFLDESKPSHVAGFLKMMDNRLYQSWGNLADVLKTGHQQPEAKADIFEEMYADKNRLREFLSAMTGISRCVSKSLAAHIPSKARTFIDIGCAQGGVPVEIALNHPQITGGGFDLPQVKPIFEEFVNDHNLQNRLKFYEGNFFKDNLPSADVLILGHILHDWNLEEKQLLVKKAFAALPSGGSLLVYDAMIDDDRNKNAFGLLMSLTMLIETPGGYDYTIAECHDWLAKAGFQNIRFESLDGPYTLAIAVKP